MVNSYYIPRGLTARISGFHPEGPGSTPGVGNIFFESGEIVVGETRQQHGGYPLPPCVT